MIASWEKLFYYELLRTTATHPYMPQLVIEHLQTGRSRITGQKKLCNVPQMPESAPHPKQHVVVVLLVSVI